MDENVNNKVDYTTAARASPSPSASLSLSQMSCMSTCQVSLIHPSMGTRTFIQTHASSKIPGGVLGIIKDPR